MCRKARATRPRVCVLWLASAENWTITLCALRFVSSASFDYYTPKYLCPPPLKTAIKSSDPRCASPRNSEVYFRGSCSDARNSHGTVIIIFSETNRVPPPPPSSPKPGIAWSNINYLANNILPRYDRRARKGMIIKTSAAQAAAAVTQSIFGHGREWSHWLIDRT